MGRVLKALDHDLNRTVAMKVLRGQEGTHEELKRFLEEAQVTGQIEHPNVLPVHDVGVTAEGDAFFTMKLVRGHETVEGVIDRLRDRDPSAWRTFTFERRVQIVQQVCHALDYAHQSGVVHRDIKPANIVLGAWGEVFLLDWGVARLTAKVDLDDGAIVGTPAYMAPEQVLGKNEEVDARSDVYALVAVLYELLTLHYHLGPIEGDRAELIAAVVGRVPIDAEDHVDRLNGRVPRQLSRICRKGLAKDPAERWQSAKELEQALQTWLEGEAPVVCPGTAIQRGLGRWSTFIDRYPVLAPAVTITVIVLGLAWIAISLLLILQPR
jgi:serine/threonine protein kinase